jgi:lipopolysaccharide export LptBFGC system permease protein LptF
MKSYQKYKIEELKIRNNLKLGVPSKNEFHIEDELSIFFENEEDDVFYNIESLIYKEGQFIKSRSARIEISKKNFNIIFNHGERILLNENEKSITNFDKFTYSIENKNIEPLLMDKEHYNTLELIRHQNDDYIYHGHNRIFQYALTLLIILASFKIIFLYEPKKNLLLKFIIIFLSLLLVQIFNSYSMYLLNGDYLNLLYYYVFNYLVLISLSIFLMKITR